MARLRAFVLLAVAALVMLAPVSAAAAVSPSAPGLTFDPSPARAEQNVTTRVDVTGADPKGTPVCAVSWDGTDIRPSCSPVRASGVQADVSFAVPGDAKPGSHRVVVTVLGVSFEGTLDVVGLVVVPDLGGLTLSQAKQTAKDAGLTLCEAPVGIVVSQEPPPGASILSSVCVAVVTKPAVFMPNLLGMSLAEARAAVTGKGLVLADPATTDGTVSSQDPAPGARVFLGSTVSVTLTAVQLVTVPDLLGHTVRDASSALTGLGLRLRGGGSDPDRLVKSQDPRPGTRIAPGSQVSVTLLPIRPVVVPVPDLRGMTVDQARTALVAARLTLELPAADAAGDARIVAQSPTAGAQVPPATAVRVTLETPAPWPPSAVLTAAAVAVLGLAVGVRALVRRRPPPPPPPRDEGTEARPGPPSPHVVLRPRPDHAVDVQVLEAAHASPGEIRLDARPDWNIDPALLEVPS